MPGVTHRDIANLIEGQFPPSEEPTRTGISPALASFDRANEDLYATLYLLTWKPASLLLLNYENEGGTS